MYRGLREAFLLTLVGINSDTMSPARGAVYLQGEALECSLCSHRAHPFCGMGFTEDVL